MIAFATTALNSPCLLVSSRAFHPLAMDAEVGFGRGRLDGFALNLAFPYPVPEWGATLGLNLRSLTIYAA